ncbi:MAG: glycoside hydrolase [Nitrospiraceae bacterium]|nr:MAG: glycoside hydrolase [Nitrospiraceae bacterium]
MKKAIEKKAYSATLSAPARKSVVSKPATGAEPKSLRKQYLKNDDICKVTFRLPKEAAQNARTVSVVGDFNNWSLPGDKMKKLKNGDFTLTIALPRSREYRFRYLVDSSRWENDWSADKYVPNTFGTDDSVVVV